jgi:hypothetical protein
MIGYLVAGWKGMAAVFVFFLGFMLFVVLWLLLRVFIRQTIPNRKLLRLLDEGKVVDVVTRKPL